MGPNAQDRIVTLISGMVPFVSAPPVLSNTPCSSFNFAFPSVRASTGLVCINYANGIAFSPLFFLS